MAKIKLTFSPLFTINAVFLGHSECFIYNKDGSKTPDPNNVHLNFATAMYQKIGETSQILPIEKVLDSLGENSTESSINCKVPVQSFDPSRFKLGSKGVLQVLAMGLGGNVYYRFIDFTTKGNVQSPPPAPAMSSSK
ncbi:hypothetical protein [Okeania sp. KiyG1]|uniref:hypothetical protein n=1 Tax=Okeania sp. KiyG1 TaxID=2720165 RepID=UPI001920FF27|nr:hypothetical protein [Okeania sp. KiyG1]GGA14792.1 hypothetical protein CYANOKiyG1_28540 [Okeania sp. KiyG1]